MGRLSRRIDKIEKALEPDAGACLRWPNPDGTFTEIPGCRSLADLYAQSLARGRGAGARKNHQVIGGCDDDGIGQNRTF
jgi:hypothetical protein